MKLPKLLTLSLLVVMMPYHQMATASNEKTIACDLKIKYELEENSETKKTKLKLVLEGGEKPFKVVLHNSEGKLQSLDFSTTEFDKLDRGEYRCVVLDKNECRAEISININ